MTFMMGSLTLGAALMFSAIKNMTLVELIKGEAGKGQPESLVDKAYAEAGESGTAVTRPSKAGKPEAVPTGTANTKVKGLVTWKNPDGSTKQIAKWIYLQLKAVGWHGYIESGYRSYQDQVATCATGVQPCATPGTSNHEGKAFPKGAIDVRETECAALSAKLKRIHSPLVYAGSKDPVHFSHPHNGSY